MDVLADEIARKVDRPDATAEPRPTAARLWRPKRVLVTRSARDWERGRVIVERAAALGAEVIELPNDRLVGLATGEGGPADYRLAKSTLAVVVASAAKRRLQPIPPSADWRFDLAEGCPAHCQYCYLAGSLSGPPITRVYANVDEILGGLAEYVGRGGVTSTSAERAAEGTTFEASCYADPLGVEHLTGSLAEAVASSDDGTPTSACASRPSSAMSNPCSVSTTAGGRGSACRSTRRASCGSRAERAPWRRASEGSAAWRATATRSGSRSLPSSRRRTGATATRRCSPWRRRTRRDPGLDLTAELITHRFTPKSKGVLTGWYPGSTLEMDEDRRTRKLTKFGSVKHVYPAALMKEMRAEITGLLAQHLPAARVLYWT